MTQPKLPKEIQAMQASRSMRLHHYLWHNLRNVWENLSSQEQQAIEKKGWKPPRPARDKKGVVLTANYSGEDFLYMHRSMIQTVNEKLKEINSKDYLKLEGWQTIPGPDDPDFPVPNRNGSIQVKSDQFFKNIQTLEKKFKDQEYLKTVTLGQLGAELEFNIHNQLHMRWANESTPKRPTSNQRWDIDNIDKRWDDISYDYLGDFYSSHVNPIFWKLHGWVDARIEDWKKANKVENINWKGTWMGPYSDGLKQVSMGGHARINSSVTRNHKVHTHHINNKVHNHHMDNVDNMEEVLAILRKSGKCLDFYAQIESSIKQPENSNSRQNSQLSNSNRHALSSSKFQISPQEKALSLKQKGREHYRLRHYQLAENCFKESIQLNNQDPETFLYIADTFAESDDINKIREAKSIYEQLYHTNDNYRDYIDERYNRVVEAIVIRENVCNKCAIQ